MFIFGAQTLTKTTFVFGALILTKIIMFDPQTIPTTQ
jgi:hypothetical protein